MQVPIYLFTGFLESGKTTLIRETLKSPDFQAYGTTVLLVCEEGEEEYEEEFLEEYNIRMVVVESPEELTKDFWKNLENSYLPEQVFIEFNGTWDLSAVLHDDYPKGYEIAGIYSTVDGTTAESYMNNMRMLIMNQIGQSDLVIVNRSNPDTTPMAAIRRMVKMGNPRVQIVFEDADGGEIPFSGDTMPFDLNAEVIEIDELDYGLWYVDAMEHPEHYQDKKVRFIGQLFLSKSFRNGIMAVGRHVMNCCAEDITFASIVCRYTGKMPLKKGDWAWITASYNWEYAQEYGEEGPVLYLMELEKTSEPENKVLGMN